jgi:ribosome-associated heat shock protein Hsp15
MYIDQTPKQVVEPAMPAHRERGSGRPTKRERRELEKFKR